MNPKPFLNELTGKPVMVKLKWGMEYKGEERGWVYVSCGGSAGVAASEVVSAIVSSLCVRLLHANN